MNRKEHFWSGFAVGLASAALCGLLLLLAGGAVLLHLRGENPGTQETAAAAEAPGTGTDQKFEEIKTLIDTYYLGEVDPEKMADAVYTGYVAGLGDLYADYYNLQDVKKLNEESTGEYKGIGIMVSQDLQTLDVIVTRVFDNGPAKEAGFQEGDVLAAVDGIDVRGLDLESVVDMIRGKEGESVDVTVRRGEEYLTLTSARRDVQSQTVTCRMLEDGIGYIELTQFEQVSVQQMADALNTLKQQGMEGLILDLRSNPGGTLDSVLAIADMFLNKTMIFYMEDKYGGRETFDAEAGTLFEGPMTVLVNEYSASASEVLSGTLQDNGAAVLVGMKTFGKGIVQSLFTLSDGSVVKFTTAHYYTPKGRDIHGTGIEPDIRVEYDPEAEADSQLAAALAALKDLMQAALMPAA